MFRYNGQYSHGGSINYRGPDKLNSSYKFRRINIQHSVPQVYKGHSDRRNVS